MADINIELNGLTDEQVEKLSALIDEIKGGNYKLFPKNKETFCFIDSRNCFNDTEIIHCKKYSDGYYPDEFSASIGNCFKTTEDAEKAIKYLKVRKELLDISAELSNGETQEEIASGWNVMIIRRSGKLETETSCKNFGLGVVHFKTHDMAQEAIERIGYERILNDYFWNLTNREE